LPEGHSEWKLRTLLLSNVIGATAENGRTGDSIIGHLAFGLRRLDNRLVQGLDYRLPNRLRQAAPELIELQDRLAVLAARGGAVPCWDIDFLLEIEIGTDIIRLESETPKYL
jgi:hypothetical protein